MTSQAPFGNDPHKVERYRAFWDRADVDRPLVGFSFKSWFPLEEFAASAAWQSADYLTSDMVEPAAFMEDQERLLREGETLDDDIFRGACPSQAVHWLVAMLGVPLRILPGSILGEPQHLPWEALEDVRLDREGPWFRKYIAFIDTLVERSAGRFPVSHATLLGPTDLFAVLRDHSQSVMDVLEEPERSSLLLWRLVEVFHEATQVAWQRIPLFYGGYYDAQYQLWAPGPIVRMQEDASGLYSPDLYRRYVQPLDRWLAGHYPCAFIHLHSTSMFLLDAFLEVDEIRCFEVNYEVNSGGPAIAGMLPYFRRIQAADRPLLVRGSFTPDEMRTLVDGLDPRGLYVYVMVETIEEVEGLRAVLGM
jgi:hypothetical protein